MKNQKGVTMVTLVITIIVILILAGLTFVGSLKTINQTNYSKYVSNVSDVSAAFGESAAIVKGQKIMEDKKKEMGQIHNYLAKNGDEEKDFLKVIDVPRYTIIRDEGQIGIDLPDMVVESGTGKKIPVKYAATAEGKIFTWPPLDHEDKFYITDEDTVEHKMQTTIKVGNEEFQIKIDSGDGSLLDWLQETPEDDEGESPSLPSGDEGDSPLAHEHDFSSKTQTAEYFCSDATCVLPKTYYYKCISCDAKGSETYTVGEALGHIFEGETLIKEANCTEKGVIQSKCTRCGAFANFDRPINPANHHGGEREEITKQPTCTETGTKSYKCSSCNETLRTVSIDMIDHNMDKVVTTKQPTCTEKGIKVFKCSSCDKEMKTEEIAALGHGDERAEITKEPTCTENGTKIYKCSICGVQIRTESINALGHSYGNFQETTAATCTKKGVRTKKCTRCNDTITEEIDALDHNYGSFVVTKEPTCLEKGERTQTCSRCNDEITEDIDALGHDWSAPKPPRKCNRCGLEENTEYTYNILYKSTSGLDLGSTTLTKFFGTTNTVVAPEITGYNTPASQSIVWDTETKIITFIYSPTDYSITIDCNGGSGVSSTSYNIETPTFTLKTPTRSGYTFTGWTDINGTTQASVTIVEGSTGAKSYTANWKKDKLPGSISLPSTVRLGVGQNGSINLAGGNVTGGTVTMTNSDSTVVRTTFDGSIVSLVGLKVGTAILTFNVAETENYTAATGQTTVIVYDANTPYTVKHWQQTVTGGDAHNDTNFALHETESLRGEGGASVTPTPKSYTGFTAPNRQTVTIANDGTTIVNYYYTRNSYTVSLTKGTGISTVTGTGSYKYGASVIIDATESSGYSWEKWTGTHNTTTKRYTFTMPAGNVNNTANAIAAVAQAIYSADDNSFTFVRRTPYSVGDVFVDRDGNSKTVTEVYTGFETDIYTNSSDIPWYENKDNITNVVVEDEITPVSTAYWFSKLKYCTTLDVTNINTSNVTDMNHMFDDTGYKVDIFNITGLDNWDTSKVTDMNNLFSCAGTYSTTFSIGDLSKWDVSQVTDMSYMFMGAGQDATTWSIGNIGNWNTSKVTNMQAMFAMYVEVDWHCATTAYLGDLSTKIVTRDDGTKYTAWDVSNVTDMSNMFDAFGHSVTNLNIGDIGTWDTSNVTKMKSMFFDFGTYSTSIYVGDIGNWNTSKVDDMSQMFVNAAQTVSEFNFGNLNTKEVTKADGTTYIAWDVSNVTNMYRMFWYAGKNSKIFNIGSISNWNTSKVTNMERLFNYAGYSSSVFNLGDLSEKTVTLNGKTYTAWDMSSVQTTLGMFGTAGYSATTWYIGDLSNWDVSNVTTMGRDITYTEDGTSFYGAYEGMFAFAGRNASDFDIGNLSNWNTSKVMNMNAMFYGCENLKTLDLSNWDTSEVTTMEYMFTACYRLERVTLGTNFAFVGSNGYLPTPSSSYITGADGKWYNISTGTGYTPENVPSNKEATYVAVKKTYTYNVEYKSESGLDLGSTTVTKWYGTTNTIVAPAITGYNTPASQNVTWDSETKTITFTYEPTAYSITIDCNGGSGVSSTSYDIETPTFTLKTPTRSGYAFTGWTDINGVTQASVTIVKGSVGAKHYTANWEEYVAQAIYSATDDSLTFIKDSLKTVGGTFVDQNGKTKAVTARYVDIETFEYKTTFETEYPYTEETNVGWIEYGSVITSVVVEDNISPISTSGWFFYFDECNNFDIEKLNTSNVKDMSFMFAGCDVLTSIDVSKFDTKNVTNMAGMFYDNRELTSVGNLANWDTSKVTDMHSMFENCWVLPSLNINGWDTSNVTTTKAMFASCNDVVFDVSNWNTSSNTDMSSMFYSCYNITQLDLRKWDTSKVTDMTIMFGCCGVTNLNASGWDTSNVTSMHMMFYECTELETLNLTGWQTDNLQSLYRTFWNCNSLKSLDLSGWNVSKVTDMSETFLECISLTSVGNISNWNTSNVENMYMMFSGCESLGTLNLSKWDVKKVTSHDWFNYGAYNITPPNWVY